MWKCSSLFIEEKFIFSQLLVTVPLPAQGSRAPAVAAPLGPAAAVPQRVPLPVGWHRLLSEPLSCWVFLRLNKALWGGREAQDTPPAPVPGSLCLSPASAVTGCHPGHQPWDTAQGLAPLPGTSQVTKSQVVSARVCVNGIYCCILSLEMAVTPLALPDRSPSHHP